MIITNSRYALVGYFITSYPTRANGIIVIYFFEKYGVTGLVFKIDAIDGKKWVRFVFKQQYSATLIYDLNAMKGTVESYLK